MIKKLLMGLMVLGLSATAQAQDGSKFRFGLGVGHVNIDADIDEFKVSASATGWEVFAGYEFNRYFAIEAGYLDGGAADDEIEGIVVEADTTAFYASAIGSLPVNDYVSFYARAGLLAWEADEEARSNGEVLGRVSLDGNDPFFGVGVSALIDNALLRLEYRLAEIEDSDLTLLSLAVAWRF